MFNTSGLIVNRCAFGMRSVFIISGNPLYPGFFIVIHNYFHLTYHNSQDQCRNEAGEVQKGSTTAYQANNGQNESNSSFSTVVLLRTCHSGGGCRLSCDNHGAGGGLKRINIL